jgi:hypothetical protein
MLSLPHFLDNPLTDGGEVVSPTRRPPFTPANEIGKMKEFLQKWHDIITIYTQKRAGII